MYYLLDPLQHSTHRFLMIHVALSLFIATALMHLLNIPPLPTNCKTYHPPLMCRLGLAYDIEGIQCNLSGKANEITTGNQRYYAQLKKKANLILEGIGVVHTKGRKVLLNILEDLVIEELDEEYLRVRVDAPDESLPTSEWSHEGHHRGPGYGWVDGLQVLDRYGHLLVPLHSICPRDGRRTGFHFEVIPRDDHI